MPRCSLGGELRCITEPGREDRQCRLQTKWPGALKRWSDRERPGAAIGLRINARADGRANARTIEFLSGFGREFDVISEFGHRSHSANPVGSMINERIPRHHIVLPEDAVRTISATRPIDAPSGMSGSALGRARSRSEPIGSSGSGPHSRDAQWLVRARRLISTPCFFIRRTSA